MNKKVGPASLPDTTLKLLVKPRSSANRVLGMKDGALVVQVTTASSSHARCAAIMAIQTIHAEAFSTALPSRRKLLWRPNRSGINRMSKDRQAGSKTALASTADGRMRICDHTRMEVEMTSAIMSSTLATSAYRLALGAS